jgi:hypothetical protein
MVLDYYEQDGHKWNFLFYVSFILFQDGNRANVEIIEDTVKKLIVRS